MTVKTIIGFVLFGCPMFCEIRAVASSSINLLRPSIYLVFAVRGREGHILPGGSHEPNVGREPSFSPNFRRYRAVQWGPLDWDD